MDERGQYEVFAPYAIPSSSSTFLCKAHAVHISNIYPE